MTRLKPLLVAAVLALAGCAPSGNDGDCSAWVRFDENMYRSHNAMPDQAPLGSSVGEGDVVGCGDEDAPAVDGVEVFRNQGR